MEDTTENLQVKKKIKKALNYIRNDSLEVRIFHNQSILIKNN
jgi:hypothetical protein